MTTRGHGTRERRKLDVDLGDVGALDRVGADQVEYYTARAAWFDDCYACTGDYDRGPDRNAWWRDRMAHIERALAASGIGGHCVELGAGTGHWTERLRRHAPRVTAIDASAEMLDIAQARLADDPAVEFEVADLWHWSTTARWDSAAAFFFLEHVPDEIAPQLLATMHEALPTGAPFFVAEGAWSEPEPNVETRDIGGREYEVVERRRAPDEFVALFGAAGFDVEFGRTDDFIDLVATRR